MGSVLTLAISMNREQNEFLIGVIPFAGILLSFFIGLFYPDLVKPKRGSKVLAMPGSEKSIMPRSRPRSGLAAMIGLLTEVPNFLYDGQGSFLGFIIFPFLCVFAAGFGHMLRGEWTLRR